MSEIIDAPKRRGRQAGQTKQKTIITDASIAPYEIHQDEYCFCIIKPVTNTPQDPTFGYFASIEAALAKILKMKMVGKNNMELKNYIIEIKALKNEIAKAFSI